MPLGPDFTHLNPETFRQVRKCINHSHRQIAEAIGESMETVFRYERGKQTDEAVVQKLRDYLSGFQICATRDGQWKFYEIYPIRPGEE